MALFMLSGDLIQRLAAVAAPHDPAFNRIGAVCLAGVVILPLALMRRLTSLWFESYLSGMCMSILVLAVLINAVQHSVAPAVAAVDTDIYAFFQSLPIAVLAFSCQASAIPVAQEMQNKDISSAVKVSNWSALVVGLVYALIGYDLDSR